MKIIIHSMDELLQLAALIRGGTSTKKVGEIEHTIKVDTSDFDAGELATGIRLAMQEGQLGGLPADIAQPVARQNELPHKSSVEELPGPTRTLHLDGSVTTDELPEHDADGVPHNTDWHSDPAKLTDKGVWRARRGRDNDAYKAWLLEQAVEVAEAAVAADAEPVATETHALPQADAEHNHAADAARFVAPTEPETAGDAGPTVDLAALVEASQEAALDASDSHMDLIKACQVFISDHGHPAYNALKAAVAPLEGTENGKAVPQFTPGERRLMRACIDNYPKG